MMRRFLGMCCLVAALLPESFAQQTANVSPVNSPGGATVVRDSTCYLEPSALSAWQKAGVVTAIDIRDAMSSEHAPLDGLMRMKVEEIKVKDFLKEQGVLMVGVGHGETGLEAVCADLKKRGFKRVRILSGGAFAWAKSQSDRELDLRPFAELSAADLIAERNDSASSFIVIPSGFNHPDFASRSVTVRDTSSEDALLASVREVAAKKKGATRRVVILGAEVIDFRVLALVLKKAAIDLPVYVFAGDGAKYGAALKDHQALWSRRNGWKPLKGCNPA